MIAPKQMAVRYLLAGNAAACSFVLSLAAAAQAQPTAAEELFRQARADMKAGRPNEACPRFKQSFQLIPTPGALLNLAICEELLGQPTLAWAKFKEFIAQVPPDDPRVSLANRHIAHLEKSLGWLELALPPDAPQDVAIWLDEEALAQGRLGTWIPLLPGRHQIELRSATHGVLNVEVVELAAAQRQSLTIASAAPSAGANLATRAVVAKRAAVPAVKRVPQQPRREWSRPPLRNGAYVSGGIALGTLAASLVLGGLSLQAKNTMARHCDGDWCDGVGFRAAQRGSRYVALADVALVVSGVATVTSATLFLAGRQKHVAVTLAPSAASLGYQSEF